MIKCHKEILKKVDIFRQPIRLYIDRKEGVNSSFGGLITICFLIFIGFTFWIYSQNCFFKLNPQVITNTEYSDMRKKLFLNKTYFMFNITSLLHIDTTPYFKISIGSENFSKCHKIINDSLNQKNLLYNGSLLTNNLYCIDFKNSTEYLNNIIPFSISYCRKNEICKSIDQINQMISDNDLSISYYLDTEVIDPQDYLNPVQKKTYEYSTKLFPYALIRNIVGFTPHKLFTDDGLIYSNNRSEPEKSNELVSIANDVKEETAYPAFCDDSNSVNYDFFCNRLFDIKFQTYQKVITYARKYQRISDVLANVGGISGIIMKVFAIIMSIYGSFIRNEHIANHLYNFNFEEKNNSILKQNNDNKLITKNPNNCNEINQNFSNLKEMHPQPIINLSQIGISKNEVSDRDLIYPQTYKFKFKSRINCNEINKANYPENKSLNQFKISDISPKNDLNAPPNSPQKKMHNISEYKSSTNEHHLLFLPLDKINEKRNIKTYRFKFYDLICYYLRCHCRKKSNLKQRFEVYQNVQNSIISILDIKTILHQIIELKNLKMVLLNNDQYSLLNFINKYNILQNNNDKISKYNLDYNFLNNEENLHKIVYDLMIGIKHSESILDPTTLKLIDYLDENYFENSL